MLLSPPSLGSWWPALVFRLCDLFFCPVLLLLSFSCRPSALLLLIPLLSIHTRLQMLMGLLMCASVFPLNVESESEGEREKVTPFLSLALPLDAEIGLFSNGFWVLESEQETRTFRKHVETDPLDSRRIWLHSAVPQEARHLSFQPLSVAAFAPLPPFLPPPTHAHPAFVCFGWGRPQPTHGPPTGCQC